MPKTAPLSQETSPTNYEATNSSQYAGVMKRGLAAYFDIILLMIPYTFLLFYFSPVSPFYFRDPASLRQFQGFTDSLIVTFVSQITFFIYFTLQYRSRYQATLGMRLVDIKLTSENFKKPSWASLSLRYFLYILPALSLIFLQNNNMIPLEFQEATFSLSGITTLILILMIALTNRKQTYYDMAAQTLVLQEPKEINPPFVYAGLSRRFFSYLVDATIIISLLGIAIYGLGIITPPEDSPSIFDIVLRPSSFIIALILPLAYSVLQYRSKHQATLGMRLLSIKIMTTDYQKPSIKRLLLRYLFDFPLFFIPFLNFISAAMILFTDRKQAHYDKMSKVIFVETSK